LSASGTVVDSHCHAARSRRSSVSAGVMALVTPDGSVRKVADDIHFPNGMVVTPDNSTLIVTESFQARLTAFDTC
jgi:sugar lactone lactonase YvrE